MTGIIRRQTILEPFQDPCQNILDRLASGNEDGALKDQMIIRGRRLFIAGFLQRLDSAKGKGTGLPIIQCQLIDAKSLWAALGIQNVLKLRSATDISRIFLIRQA